MSLHMTTDRMQQIVELNQELARLEDVNKELNQEIEKEKERTTALEQCLELVKKLAYQEANSDVIETVIQDALKRIGK